MRATRDEVPPRASIVFDLEAGVTFGGAEEDRTPDLLNAIQALSQLSYGPTCGKRAHASTAPRAAASPARPADLR